MNNFQYAQVINLNRHIGNGRLNSNSLGNSGKNLIQKLLILSMKLKKLMKEVLLNQIKTAGVDKLSNTPSSNHEKNGKNSEGQYVSLSQGTNNSKESVYSQSYSKMQKRNETVNLKHGKYDN